MAKPAPDVDAEVIAFEAFGVRALVSVHAADPGDLAALLPPGWRPCPTSAVQKRFTISPDSSGTYALIKDKKNFTKGLPLELAMELLEAQVRAYVALHATERIFVHAGAVAHNGRIIVIPGMTFAGKSTLVAALVRAGAIYYSDEFSVLDKDGFVHPYARPLSLRGMDALGKNHPVESLGGTAGEQPLPIGLVAVTTYRPGAVWQPKRLSAGEGVLALMSNTVPAQTRSQEALRNITRAVEGAVVIQSERAEADALAPLLLAELEA